MKGRPGVAKRTTMHPIIKQLFTEAAKLNLTMQNIADATGMARETLSHWQHHRREPSLLAVEAALNAVNLGLAVVPLNGRPVQRFRRQLLSRGNIRREQSKMQQRLSAGVDG